METENNKPWKRPWSAKEIAENANNWSLAADVGLLKHLEQFADNLLGKCEQTNTNLEKQLDQLQNVSLSLDIAKSKFLSLQNTQFIENRVYEDDETEVAETVDSQKEKKEGDTERKEIMRSAVLKGLSILDKYYEKIDVPASDSEDDDDGTTNFVLNPKDPYLSRQLPYIIGSEEWHKKWHVGLIESSSESEEDKVSEKYSDSDSELDLPVANRLKSRVSDTVSDDYSDKMFTSQSAVTSSTARQSDSPISADNEGNEQYQPSSGTNIFAEELAQKLGNVLTGSNNNEPEVNRRPIQKPTTNQQIGGFFNDEPPPIIDNLEEAHHTHGIFSGGTGLFDDEDDTDSLWNASALIKPQQTDKEPNKAKEDIFNENEDDLFAPPKVEPAQAITSKKIIGGQSIIPNLFSNKEDLKKLRRRHDSTDSSSDEIQSKSEQSNVKAPVSESTSKPMEAVENYTSAPNSFLKKADTPKKISLFDDEDDDNDLFNDDSLFPSTTPKKLYSSDIFEDDLFADVPAVSTKPKPKESEPTPMPNMKKEKSPVPIIKEKKTVVSLFDDDDDDMNDDLFGYVPSFLKKTEPANKSLKEDLFEGSSKQTSNNDDEPPPIEEHNSSEQKTEDTSIKVDPVPAIVSSSHDEKSSTIDTQYTETISEEYKPNNTEAEAQSSDVNDFASLIQSTVQKVHTSFLDDDDLFDEPPPLPNMPKANLVDDYDDDWDTKNDEDDLFNSAVSSKRSIFDSEPPSLFGNKSESTPPRTFISNQVDDIFEDFSKKPEKIETKEEIKEVESSSSVKDKFLEQITKLEEATTTKQEIKSPPGKLKHKLNINVNALLPGLGLPKKKEVVFDNNDEKVEDEVAKEEIISEQKFETLPKEKSTERVYLPKEEDTVEVLQSITKDRAKPLNRRPSTRKARQEQLRKSGIDFDYDSQKQKSVLQETKSIKKDIPSTESIKSDEKVDHVETPKAQNNVLNTVTFEDLFGDDPVEKYTPPKDIFNDKKTSSKQINTEDVSHAKSLKEDIFDKSKALEEVSKATITSIADDLFDDNTKVANEKASEATTKYNNKNFDEKPKEVNEKVGEKMLRNDLFDNEPDIFDEVLPKPKKNESKKHSVLQKKGLFDDDDSDDNLFPTKPPTEVKIKEATKVTIQKLPSEQKTEPKKKGLFDDDDEADDFFAKKLPAKPKTVKKASLFDDDESSEDDIFGTPSSATKKTDNAVKPVKEKAKKKTSKTTTVKKLDSVIVKDPLDAFKN